MNPRHPRPQRGALTELSYGHRGARHGTAPGSGTSTAAEVSPRRAEAGDLDLVVYAGPEAAELARRLPQATIRRLPVKKYSPAEQVGLAWAARRDRLDLLHIPFYVAPLAATCPVVLTLHDLELLRVPGAAPSRAGQEIIRAMHRLAVRKARAIITVSAAS